MSSIIKRLDKRTGITYVYESTSYWDKEKKQPRSKRVLIGKVDPNTNEVVPTDGRGIRRKEHLQNESAVDPVRQGPVPVIRTERVFCGATYLFDQIGEITGIQADLKTCFPNSYKQILSIAYYLILEGENPFQLGAGDLTPDLDQLETVAGALETDVPPFLINAAIKYCHINNHLI